MGLLLDVEINVNNLSSVVCDMYDIKDRTRLMWDESKDEDNSIFTVKDCLDEVIHFLEGLEGQVEEQYPEYQDDHGG
jgi:hypothetical protein